MRQKSHRCEALLDRLRVLIPEAMRGVYAPNSCIASTRIAVDVLRACGVRARPLATKVTVMNEAMWQRFDEKDATLSKASRDKRAATDLLLSGAYMVQMGYGAPGPGPGYDGHLVAVVEEKWALDLSMAQAARPKKGISVGPRRFGVTKDFLRGEDASYQRIGTGGGIHYLAQPKDKAWAQAPDWARNAVQRRVTRDVLKEVGDWEHA